MQLSATILVVGLTVYFVIRGYDARFALFTGGLLLAALALRPLKVFEVFLAEMGNGRTIGPICSAMGYAYVLKITGCDRAMVRLLVRPLRRTRWLLIPGGCIVGFVTNIAVTSQTAVAAAVAPILVPLLLAAGYSRVLAAATLILGSSGGGSLYNPGDADLVAIQESSRSTMKAALDAMAWPLVAGFLTAVAVFTLQSRRAPREADRGESGLASDEAVGAPVWKALLPPLPVALIFLSLPGFIFHSLPAPFERGMPVAYAMLASTILVLLCCRREVSATVKAFFEGMGYAYANVVSLIITSSCFIAGLTEVGLTDRLVRVVSDAGLVAKAVAVLVPGVLGVVSGSGIGPSVAFCKAVLPNLTTVTQSAVLDLGVLSAVAASFGRTMSPVAAVVVFSASFANVPVLKAVKQTAPALVIGILAALITVVARSR